MPCCVRPWRHADLHNRFKTFLRRAAVYNSGVIYSTGDIGLISKKIVLLVLLSVCSSFSMANVDSVKSKLAQQYPNVKIDNIQATEMQGMYSANLDGQVVYINQQAQHIFVGSMIRIKDQHNLSKDLVQQRSTATLSNASIDYAQLPLQDAIKTVKGNGQRSLVVFSDPNCPYCKTLDNHLAQLNNVTIYTFLYPLKSQSIQPSKQVWCSSNRSYAWKNLIQNNRQPTAAANCDTPIERNLALGQRLGLHGTPAIIFANGHRVMGAYPAKEIEKLWQQMGL